mmetsp:Transcript_28965/g.56848  ORF Transcript_28965/g.56848 Transcript_28965/m.56848 type:complete len:357 (-) Transcript_28965:331-1401(-)|eukprot:CAMPEP_0175120428 /NCGR_PEP_ID=MMETSP0087-20121206/617_1 /TAXON_ID=136419 /ORGANISM="Unknown Unknown, Strain D1" /LENGTH=356 /DNA_ID=CAMNT_0016401877 /DNA_START=43 /DNA_END=1113 /DNA_ORIENTATION=+
MSSKKLVLSVFWCGTAGSIDGQTTQVALFYHTTKAVDVKVASRQELQELQKLSPQTNQFKVGFDGCGHTNGMMGTIFATGLQAECAQVVQTIKDIKHVFKKHLTVNVLGLSRGGMAALLLAKLLGKELLTSFDLNLCLFDPVPGNLVTSARLDFFGLTLRNKCMDVSGCIELRNVLALYPYEPLPDIAFHAPILPKYPDSTNVVEDVLLGCHQGALFFPDYKAGRLSYFLIRKFFREHGTMMDENKVKVSRVDESVLLDVMDNVMQANLANPTPTTRHVHSLTPARIVRRSLAQYLNRHHYDLSKLARNLEESKQSPAEVTSEHNNQGRPMFLLDIERQVQTRSSILRWSCGSKAN